jgi:hypothetical protein
MPVIGGGDAITVQGVPFSEFARRLKAAPTSGEYVYMQDGIIDLDNPVRRALQLDFLNFANPRGAKSKFWIGSDGQVFNLHYDDFLNFICMLDGTKRVTMIPPDQLPNMYHAPFDVLCGYACTTPFQLLKPDFDRYPKFRTALEHARVAVLEPGDVLVIPPFWWHHVESFSPIHVMVGTFVMISPFTTCMEAWKGLSEAMREMARAPQEERIRARESFRRSVLGNSEERAEHPLAEKARQVARKLAPSWRKQLLRLYEEFAFQVDGDPFALFPGGMKAFLERQAQQPTLFPFANLLAAMPDQLELTPGDPQPQ